MEINFAQIPFLAIILQQTFVHATTAQLSCQVQNFVAIAELEFRESKIRASSNLNCDGKIISKMDARQQTQGAIESYIQRARKFLLS